MLSVSLTAGFLLVQSSGQSAGLLFHWAALLILFAVNLTYFIKHSTNLLKTWPDFSSTFHLLFVVLDSLLFATLQSPRFGFNRAQFGSRVSHGTSRHAFFLPEVGDVTLTHGIFNVKWKMKSTYQVVEILRTIMKETWGMCQECSLNFILCLLI